MARSLVALLVASALVLGAAPSAEAHGLRAGFIDLEEVASGKALVHTRSGDPQVLLEVTVDDGCALAAPEVSPGERRPDGALILTCADGQLAGHTLTVEGLGPFVADAVVRARYADGSAHGQALTRENKQWLLRAAEGFWTTTRHYVSLGVEHIATGYDHLLFLLLLVLALRSPRKVLLAETAFTLSHSLSFSATALGWIRVSPSAAEAAIAWSLVLLALDVGRRHVHRGSTEPGEVGKTNASIAGLAFAFGLVHGLGFAGGLREIGLPEGEVGAALLGFAGGVELGQVVFLAALLVGARLLSRVRPWRAALEPLALAGAYAGGILATCWLLQRLVLVLVPV